MNLFKNHYILKLVIIIIIFFIDRLSKNYIINLFNHKEVEQLVLNKFINIFLIWNEGIAFGLLNFDDQNLYKLLTVIIFIICIIIFYMAMKNNDLSAYFFIIIFGGAIGNLYDRLVYKSVPDFIDFHINNLHWFIFNIADIFITLGVICLILDEIIFKNLKFKK